MGKIELYPTQIEAYQDGDVAFVVKAFDEECAEIEIKTLVNESDLPALFSAIHEAVVMLRLKTDESNPALDSRDAA